MWVITVIVGIFIFVNTQPIRPHDFWWHIALGREIVSSGGIPEIDIFSYTMYGAPYPSFQMFWLADIVLFGVYDLGGAELVVFVQSLLITVSYGLLLWLSWKLSNNWQIAALATLFAVALGINNWNVRPQTISYLIGILFILAIYSYRSRARLGYLAVFPIGMLVWVNSHGSFVIGFVLLGIWLADEGWGVLVFYYKAKKVKSLNSVFPALITFVLTLGICFINPRGLGILSYIQNLTGNPMVQDLVPEWAPPSFDNLSGIIFLIGFMISAVILSVSPKRPSFFQLVTFVVFGILGLITIRGSVWFGIVIAPVIADHLANLSEGFRKEQSPRFSRARAKMVNSVILILLLIGAVISLPWFKIYLPLPPLKAGVISSETPIQATEFLLNEELPGEIFHDMGFGSYLIWAAKEDYKVFIDPRIELFPIEIWRDYVVISNGLPGWMELLEKYQINTVMVDSETQVRLKGNLEESPQWSKIFEDHAAVIFVQDGEK